MLGEEAAGREVPPSAGGAWGNERVSGRRCFRSLLLYDTHAVVHGEAGRTRSAACDEKALVDKGEVASK